MNQKSFTCIFFTSLTLLMLASCQQKSSSQENGNLLNGEGVEVSDAWARPGAEGRMSAAYFLVSNFNGEDDVLLSVETNVAQTAEVHESYEREDGMMGMREIPKLDLPAQSTVRFEQGGLHVMLIDLTRRLSEGDTFKLKLVFENGDSATIDVPVRL